MEAPPLFPEAPQDEDDDSESALDKKRAKRFESKDDDEDKPKRISLENLFVREEIKAEDDKPSDITEIFNRKREDEPVENAELLTQDTADSAAESASEDSSLETLDEDETRYAAEAIAMERTENLQQELETVEPGSAQEAEVLAGAAFVENVLDHAAQGEIIDETTLDQAAAEAADDIGGALEDEPVDTEAETDDDEPEGTGIATSSPTAGAGGSGTPPPPPSGGSTPVGGGTGGTGGTGGGSSGTTPPPSGGGTPLPVGFPAALRPAGAVGAPTVSGESNYRENEQDDRHSHVKYVMAGGIVGYMLGRRRGRIKTEARLMPVQKKLETQVESLTGQIAEREMRLRKLAREQYDKRAFDSRSVVEKLNQKNEKRAERTKAPLPLTPEQTVVAGNEHIPAAAATAEYRRPSSERTPEKNVESMKLTELLQVAAMIEVGGQSAKSLFEAGRIDTPALRRIIKEYMHNGDFKKELMQSMRPEVYDTPEDGMESQKIIEKQEASNAEKHNERSDEQQQTPHHQYPQLNAADETPKLHTVYEQDNAIKSSDMTRKLLVGVGATVGVIVLALIVGGLLLLVI